MKSAVFILSVVAVGAGLVGNYFCGLERRRAWSVVPDLMAWVGVCGIVWAVQQ